MSDANPELVELCTEFIEKYRRDELLELAKGYPQDKQSLWVDHNDVYSFNSDLALDLLEHAPSVIEAFEEAIPRATIPIDVDLSGAHVRLTGLPDQHTYSPGELRSEQAGKLVSVSGVLERVTSSSDRAEEVVYECMRCPTTMTVPQNPQSGELQEPYQCDGCERKGPFKIKHGEGEFVDFAKLRIDSRPDTGAQSHGKLTGYVMADLVDYGGESGLLGRAGEPVEVTGILKRRQKSGRNSDGQLFDHVLEVRGVEFEKDEDTVDVDAHKDEFQALAERGDAVDLFAESIAPNLHTTDAWDAAMEFAVAYLFGAPRIDVPQGPTYRGDLHFMIISDYGMGKSDFSSDIEAYSPKCISKSTTALSSGVGLTAAAVEDDFGDGAWTIKPGLLVRANGGHLILDEIDKGPDSLTDMNDALEGKQQVDVEKAGKSMTYNSRTGVMALGNPVDGRFDPTQPVSQQMGISDSLLSRFDGIVTMEDVADEAQDKRVASTYGRAYTEAQQAEYGDREEYDVLERAVPIDVGRAWIQYARENVNPILSYAQFEELESWYASEVRQLNTAFAGEGDGGDMPVPATVRVLGTAVKMSIAFARVRLQDSVGDADIERAKKLGKRLIKQNWDGEKFDAARESGSEPSTQREEVTSIVELCQDEAKSLTEIVEATGISESKAEHQVEKLKEKGELYQPQNGVYRAL